jgi:hypothetical protein
LNKRRKNGKFNLKRWMTVRGENHE